MVEREIETVEYNAHNFIVWEWQQNRQIDVFLYKCKNILMHIVGVHLKHMIVDVVHGTTCHLSYLKRLSILSHRITSVSVCMHVCMYVSM